VRWAVIALLAGCGFTKSSDGDDVSGEMHRITDDDLAGEVTDGVLENGTIVPDGFVLGGLHARGYMTQIVNTGEDVAKVFADADATAPSGADYAQVPTDWMGGRPKRLGLMFDINFDVVYDGEVLLPKGEITIEADFDDLGVAEILGNEIAGDFNGLASMTFTVPEAGWYPIRAAVHEGNGDANVILTIIQAGVRTPIDGERLRARVTSSPGLLVYSFDKQGFVGERGHTWRPTIDDAFSVLAPPWDTTTSADTYSLRYAGQLRIDTAGTYTFGATYGDATDGFRLWIDGEPRAQHWLGHPETPTADVQLEAGWHSIAVDYSEETVNSEIHVTMMGPDTPAGGVIPTTRLRPVVVFGNTMTFANVTTPATILDGQSTFLQLPLDGTQLTLIDSVDVGFRIETQDMTTLAITLFDCNGARPLTVNPTPSYHYYPADKTCAGKSTNPAPDWQIRINDAAVGNVGYATLGTVRDYGVTALYHGGPNMPFAPVVTYVGAPQMTPGAETIESVSAIGSLDDATVQFAIRTGADEAALAAAPFVDVRDGIRYEASELVQVRTTISSNGWVYPVLDKVEVVYSTPP
jgi:subtilisin-like proprotein convertase family protein